MSTLRLLSILFLLICLTSLSEGGSLGTSRVGDFIKLNYKQPKLPIAPEPADEGEKIDEVAIEERLEEVKKEEPGEVEVEAEDEDEEGEDKQEEGSSEEEVAEETTPEAEAAATKAPSSTRKPQLGDDITNPHVAGVADLLAGIFGETSQVGQRLTNVGTKSLPSKNRVKSSEN